MPRKRHAFDAAMREYCDRNYHQVLPITAEKVHQEKVQQEKLKAVKARLNFEEALQHSESGTPSKSRDLKKRIGSRRVRSMSESPEPRRDHSEKNASKIRLKFTTSNREIGNPRKSLCGDEMMRVTTTFLGGEVAASNHKRKKPFSLWKQQEAAQKQNFKKGGFQNQHRSEQKQDMFTLLTKTPKEILALDKGKFKPPPLMTTPIEKRNASNFCELHGEVGHTTDECIHLKRQIKEMLKAGKLSHLIKELKKAMGKIRKRQQKIRKPQEEDKTEGPMIIEAEMGGHFVHHMYVDGGSSSEILYKHCFNRFRPEVRNQMVPATTSLFGFSGEIIWPLGKISLLVKIGDEEHSTSAWMNFIIVRFPSLYSEIIERPGIRRIQAVQSTAHRMLNFLVTGGTVTLRSTTIIPLECTMVSGPGVPQPVSIHLQNKKGQEGERNKAIYEEVEKLVDVGIIKEVHYHSWLSNPVMVKKHDGSWRMCMDFKDLNKACLKDGYPLPKIDWKEVIKDIKETFKTLREINMKLNPKKCTFVMREGMFLGYKVNADELKVSSDKVEAVICLPSPKCLKDVQRLKLANLNRFLSNLAEKSLPFFKTLKKCTKKSDFQWTAEAETSFKQMKTLISELLWDGKQMPIYFVSRALQGLEINYTPMEKSMLALVSANKRLKRYFHAHTIVVITEQPIKHMLSNPEVAGRLLKWRFELEEHYIHYRPRTSRKGQILADFIVKRPEDDPQDTPMKDKEELTDPWILFTNGSSCIDGSGAGLIITNSEGVEFTYNLRFRFDATNNEAEYEALIAGLWIAEQMGVKNLQANVNSWLLANQVNGTYIEKEPGMIKYLEKVKALTSTFKEFSIKQVPRGANKKVDALSKMESTSFAHLIKQVLVEELKEKSIGENEVLVVVEEWCTWMTQIHEYLIEDIPLEKKRKARAIRHKARRYVVTNGVLYKRSFLGPWLRCVGLMQENYVLREIHEGSCSMHTGLRPFGRKREQARIREAKIKAKMEKYYNTRVRNTSFKPGDIVYQNNETSHAEDGGKLGPKWEGPYEVTEALGKGAYKLRDRNGNILSRTRNVCNSKKFYVHEM
nr:reverse transcriptase domain-containing protein [Tanacetum cinerariifolium]